MSLMVDNLTGGPITLAGGNPPPTIAASTVNVNVTSELRGLTEAAYTALQTQVNAGLLRFHWTDAPEFITGAMQTMPTMRRRMVEALAPSESQTVFPLQKTPTDPAAILLSVNGALQTYGEDFTVTGATLTWLNTNFALSAGDSLIAVYESET